MKTALALTILLFAGLTVAAELRSQRALSHQQTATSFTAELGTGFHFNDKAPNGIVSKSATIKPKQLSAKKITFNYSKVPAGATAQVYVCDDAVTFCETHSIPLRNMAN